MAGNLDRSLSFHSRAPLMASSRQP
jgi:hypothetical protein